MHTHLQNPNGSLSSSSSLNPNEHETYDDHYYRKCGAAAGAARCLASAIIKLVNSSLQSENMSGHHAGNETPHGGDRLAGGSAPAADWPDRVLNSRGGQADPSLAAATTTTAMPLDAKSMLVEDTAGALVGFVRLSLVILICVLLVKLRSVKSGGRRDGHDGDDEKSGSHRNRNRNHNHHHHHNRNHNHHQESWWSAVGGGRREGRHPADGDHDDLCRETTISGVKEADEQSINNNSRSNELNQLAGNGGAPLLLSAAATTTTTTTGKQQVRRHSQASGPLEEQHKQTGGSAAERRRRHSDTTAAIARLQLPPGPMGLPFLGYLPFLGNEIHLTLTELARKFGPIYQIFLGGIRVVVLNDAALVRQAFKQTVFSGRPNTQLTRILQGYGIVNSEGALWKEQRAFLHSALRKLGAKSLMSGSNGLEAKIQNQVKEFVNDLSEHAKEGKPCQVRPIVARAVSSVVGSIVMNLTYRKYEEKEKFDRLIELMQEGFRLFSIAMPLDFIPIFKYLPGVSYAYQKMKKNRQETSAFFQTVADEHRKYLSDTFNLGAPDSTSSLHPATAGVIVPPMAPSSVIQSHPQPQVKLTTATATTTDNHQGDRKEETNSDAERMQTRHVNADANANVNLKEQQQQLDKPAAVELESIVARDLVDAYIVQQKKHETDGKENYFSDQQLVQIMSDIFSAGLETVTSTIEWSILFLILNVDCQAKIQDEIDRIIGRQRSPQLEDLAQMPYTEATIYEVLRRSNVVTLGNAHATLADASIGGYLIPKGTQVLPNLYGMNMNPELWTEPDRFNPSRFITNERAQKPDYFIPFSVGRRMCLGDVLAKMEVFLFLVGLLQRYDLSVHHEDRHSPPQVKGTIGVSNAPASFRVALSQRPDSVAQAAQ